MKLITLLFALILSQTAFAEVCVSGRGANLDYAGAPANIEKCSISVLNKKGSTLAAGTAVVLDTSNDDGASVTTLTTAGLSPHCIIEKSCAANKMCDCQTYGLSAVALFDPTGANSVAGKRWFLSTNNAGYISARGTDLATEVAGGVFYDVASATGAVEIFINLR